MGAYDELVVEGSCEGISVTFMSVISYSLEIMIAFLVGRDVFVSALCLG